jgi:G3E family GTPase
MSVRRPPPPFPLTVLTGFLGAGKTTLLNAALKDPALADTLVIVNEFGDVGLDHLLTQGMADEPVLLPSGCLCCAVRGDLTATLENLLRQRDNGRIAPFQRVVLETSGLADPVPVIATIVKHPYLTLRYTVPRVLTAVDAINLEETLVAHPQALSQIAVADLLVLTKTDLLHDQAKRPVIRGQLKALNPFAPILESVPPALPRDALFPIDQAQGGNAALMQAVAHNAERPQPDHITDNRHGVTSFVLERDEPIPSGSVALFLDLLQATRGPNLLRVKGLVATLEEPDKPLVIHAVQHLVHPPERLDIWPDASRRTRLVFIVKDVDPGFLAGLWDAFAGRPRA